MGDDGFPAIMGMAREYRGNHSLKKRSTSQCRQIYFFMLVII